MKMEYLHRITSENISTLNLNEVFVFGSNESGIHGAGAALVANEKFNFPFRMGFGLHFVYSGCFAIPTKDWIIKVLPIQHIEFYVNRFIEFTQTRKDLTFLVTQIGCGLSGYSPHEIAPLFKDCIHLENVHLPKAFWEVLVPNELQIKELED